MQGFPSVVSFRECDGGRAAAGFKGSAGDCGVRAAAIVTGRDYQEVYEEIFERQRTFKAKSRRKAVKERTASPREGVWKEVMHEFMQAADAEWIPLSTIGGEVVRVEDVAARWPKGRLVMRLGKHFSAMVDPVNMDSWAQHPQKRVYGVWFIREVSCQSS